VSGLGLLLIPPTFLPTLLKDLLLLPPVLLIIPTITMTTTTTLSTISTLKSLFLMVTSQLTFPWNGTLLPLLNTPLLSIGQPVDPTLLDTETLMVLTETTFFSVPDCSDPVTYNNVNLLATGNPSYVFNVPGYNSSVDYSYSGAYAYVAVPAGISGSVNFTCNSTTTGSFLVFSHNAQANCASYYVDYLYCTSSTSTTSDYFNLISQDLYTGGYWTIGVCNNDYTDAVITINTAGSVAAAPSASPSSAASVGASASPDSNSDSSVSTAIFPALFVIALAALVAF